MAPTLEPAVRQAMTDRPGGGRRSLKVRVKSARRRKPSSSRWLARQLNDPYVARAAAEGRRARSAYKLIEIDDRFHLLAPGQRIVDLGAAPGGWSEVAAERVRASDADRRVIAVDMIDMRPIPGVIVLKRDILAEDAAEAIRSALGGAPVDVVLSDLAAPTTGHRQTDHLRTMRLCEAAADFASTVLRPGGAFLAKVFRGGTEGELLARLKRDFASLNHVKPPASRAESVELYVVARGFRALGLRER